MSFRLTREAEEDVTNIYRYSVENFGEAQADTYHDGLTDCFRLLADTPLIGRD
jgi:toxin ParE1/3/4